MISWMWTAAVLISGSLAIIQHSPLQSVKEWDLASFNFGWEAPVYDEDFFNPEHIVTTGIALGEDKIYVATPRLLSGVPATVSSISRTDYEGGTPVLEAYPNWSFHEAGLRRYNCSDLGLVSVYRVRIDSCNRLWTLDAGVSRSLEDSENTCPPKILIFDLSTNAVVRRIDFPPEVVRGESLFTNLIIDETTSIPGGNCDDVFVYISDTVEPAIVVYDSSRDVTYRLTHHYMYPNPDYAVSEIEGDSFVLMDGIIGLAFDETAGIIYFQPLATDRLFSISKQVLRAGPVPITEILPVKVVGKKSSQGMGLAVSNDGSVFFSPFTETAVGCWNPDTNQQKILAYDREKLQFVADMTISNHDPTGLYLLSSKFQRFFLQNINPYEINTRIIRIELPQPKQSFYQPFSLQPSFPPVHHLRSEIIVHTRPRMTTRYVKFRRKKCTKFHNFFRC